MQPTQKDLRFLAWSVAGAKIFSKCGRRQYMAIITSPDGRVIGTGYNGTVAGLLNCIDGGCSRLDAGSEPGRDYGDAMCCHSERNALMHSDRTLRQGGTLYVNGQPCWECAKMMVNSGLARVVHLKDHSYVDHERTKAMMLVAGLEVVEVDRRSI